VLSNASTLSGHITVVVHMVTKYATTIVMVKTTIISLNHSYRVSVSSCVYEKD